MGQYNPHAPYILGQEWVPIRNAHYVSDGVVERGYAFTLDATTVPVSGAFYVETPPENRLANACEFISVYPAGRETLTGPVKRARISASAIAVNNPGSIDVTEGVAALLNSEDPSTIIFDADTSILSQLRVSFDTNAYAEILLGKRILDVRVRYQLFSNNVDNAQNMSIDISDTSTSRVHFPQITEISHSSDLNPISTLSITEMDPFWDSTAVARAQRTVLPWRFQELNRFRSGASPALVVQIQNNAIESDVFLGFMQLEVIYCEETRVLYGGFKTYDSGIANTPTLLTEFYNVGAIATRLYSPVTHTQGATLPAGDYVVTVYHRDMASRSTFQGAPRLHALREYYRLLNQRGVHVHQTTILDAEFTAESADVLTQLTLHTATQIVTGSHPYGTQYGAPVYGSRFANQEIEDDLAPLVSTPFPQVRFYARRYGNTTVPLKLADVATGTNTVSISVADFDALDEIVDGWREVTLRFDNPPSFVRAAGAPDWRWTAASELVGNQWQVMVADGPTGAWQPNPAAAATGPATYWTPFGDTVTLTWQSPSVSGVANDPTSDAVLIFSQDPPAVTGFGSELLEQELDVALRCETPQGCVPSALDYVRLSWNALGICDTFDVAQVDGWPTSTSGHTWSFVGGTIPGNYDVADGRGMHTLTSVNVSRSSVATADAGVLITDLTVDIGVDTVAAGAAVFAGPGIGSDTDNFYQARMRFNTDGTTSLDIIRRVGGAQTTITSQVTTGTYAVEDMWSVRIRYVNNVVYAKAWAKYLPEPAAWTLTVTDTNLTSFTTVVLRSLLGIGSTNVDLVVYWDNVSAPHAPLLDGTIELQRRDAYADWQTIMNATRVACVATFDDYEARVGVSSEYRIRTLNALDFAGPWVTGAATVPAPGVTVAGDASSVLIFTSNEQPGSNLAYTMQWQNQPVETFAFPEADFVTLQRLFGRDFFLAVRPLERGGERFTRTLLVNNAAIALPSLANFRGLRDLAWADLNYVCVRDELGNRWFATVIVPDGEVRGDRTIYLARVDIIEVTDTPVPLDPS